MFQKLKQYFIDLGDNRFYKQLMKDPITYVAGAVLLAVFQIAHFITLGSGWGVTSSFAYWGAWVAKVFGVNASSWSYFAGAKTQTILANGFLSDGGSIRNLGIIFGALMATLYASQFKIKKIKAVRQIVAAVLGGLLMGYGARLAGGCNIGALFTASASFSLSGWVFGAFLLVGAFLGSRLLSKYFM